MVIPSSATQRNTAVLGATTAVVSLLLLYPTSTNNGPHPRRPGHALAAAGIVTLPSPLGKPVATRTSAVLVVNGTSYDTQYGPVQVQLRIRNGRIISATAIDYPQTSNVDLQINGYALPILEQETVAAQSARIDTVSGATFTSMGYLGSLQAALDAAHLHA